MLLRKITTLLHGGINMIKAVLTSLAVVIGLANLAVASKPGEEGQVENRPQQIALTDFPPELTRPIVAQYVGPKRRDLNPLLLVSKGWYQMTVDAWNFYAKTACLNSLSMDNVNAFRTATKVDLRLQCDVAPKDIKLIAQIPQLVSLECCGTLARSMTCSDLAPLTTLTNLNTLYFCLEDKEFRDREKEYDRQDVLDDYMRGRVPYASKPISQDDVIMHFTQCKRLQSLDLSSSDFSEIDLLNKFTMLRDLDLSRTKISAVGPLPESLESFKAYWSRSLEKLNFKGLTNLGYLDLSLTPVENINPLTALRSLTTLKLNDCKSITHFEPLGKLTRLANVGLSGTQVGEDDLALLSLSLKSLNVSKCPNLVKLYNLSTHTRLKTLKIDSTSIWDFGYLPFSLTSISVGGCIEIADEDFKNLRYFTKLTSLDARRTKLNNAAQYLPKSLKFLDLSESCSEPRFEDKNTQYLKRLTRLETLRLMETGIGAGVTHLSALTRLKELDVAYTQVSAEGLSSLTGLTNLTRLYLSDAPAESNIDDLRKIFPHVKSMK